MKKKAMQIWRFKEKGMALNYFGMAVFLILFFVVTGFAFFFTWTIIDSDFGSRNTTGAILVISGIVIGWSLISLLIFTALRLLLKKEHRILAVFKDGAYHGPAKSDSNIPEKEIIPWEQFDIVHFLKGRGKLDYDIDQIECVLKNGDTWTLSDEETLYEIVETLHKQAPDAMDYTIEEYLKSKTPSFYVYSPEGEEEEGLSTQPKGRLLFKLKTQVDNKKIKDTRMKFKIAKVVTILIGILFITPLFFIDEDISGLMVLGVSIVGLFALVLFGIHLFSGFQGTPTIRLFEECIEIAYSKNYKELFPLGSYISISVQERNGKKAYHFHHRNKLSAEIDVPLDDENINKFLIVIKEKMRQRPAGKPRTLHNHEMGQEFQNRR